MHFRQKLTFMAFGSILTIAGYLLATLTSDVTAQPETDKSEPLIVDEIVCRKLRVVDQNDKTGVVIGAGYMVVYHADGKRAVSISAFKGGLMVVHNTDGKSVVDIGVFRDGGSMRVNRADGKNVVSINEILNGGCMDVKRADGETAVFISPNDADNAGMVTVHSKSMKVSAQLTANEHGGELNIFGNTDRKTRVRLGINERGHGTINTWDKNGYRTRP